MRIKGNSNLLDPNKVHVVNAYTGKVYAEFELDIEARQYMRNMLLTVSYTHLTLPTICSL